MKNNKNLWNHFGSSDHLVNSKESSTLTASLFFPFVIYLCSPNFTSQFRFHKLRMLLWIECKKLSVTYLYNQYIAEVYRA